MSCNQTSRALFDSVQGIQADVICLNAALSGLEKGGQWQLAVVPLSPYLILSHLEPRTPVYP